MSFNKIIIIGNLGRDPELRYTPQGIPVCTFSVATNERRRDSTGELQERTLWFRVTAWRRLAELANQYLKKGSLVYVEGRLYLDEYTDREGLPRTQLRIEASDVRFLDRKPVEEGGVAEEPLSSISGFEPGDEDVPF
ncbi:MAG: single-stranded DNA-binding protein [Blastocatellia bacterium]|nr:single-stranded DNA-binding protein [Blastocatellia bacterium]MCS7158036.1 single-stranded DNA-binding protein [Blastocatellia bacterium]MCX7752543.1 single-stranded DNA-binding protein [Blastocatellia bacterium]MDW8167342.1 single-stranded DNA-binding protein [Acidobacteriota bacterium]MDW8257333.1 single-stranded DNA-binding protein [Acidobacteriota bacterium]